MLVMVLFLFLLTRIGVSFDWAASLFLDAFSFIGRVLVSAVHMVVCVAMMVSCSPCFVIVVVPVRIVYVIAVPICNRFR